ncbi:hypothetical protein ACIQWV_16560 [Streptomyces sp. NPDC098085]
MLHDDMADIAASPVLDFAAIHRGLPVTVTQVGFVGELREHL